MNYYTVEEKFVFESGQSLDELKIAYQTFGKLNEKHDNVIWVFHAISGHADVLEWWSSLFGENKPYDPNKHFIICANCIGSPYGSTRPLDFSFPHFTVRDQANAYIKLAQHLGIQAIHTVIGGSFGGYQALEFAHSYEGDIAHLILLASSSRESAWGIAVHEAQRMALRADATFGNLNGGEEGLKAARALALLTYRTSNIMINDQTDTNNQVDGFKASSYVNYQGNKFSENFDSLCLYYLTKCIDSHNIGRKRGGETQALQKINIPTLVIGFTSDLLVPIESQRFLARNLPNAFLTEIDSTYGHDGFLMESEKISESIIDFYATNQNIDRRTLLKFGGSSLYGKEQLNNVINIVIEASNKNPIALVVSARGKTTDKLIELYELAKQGTDFSDELNAFISYSKNDMELDQDFDLVELKEILNAVKLLKIDSQKAKDRVLSFGELISANAISKLLNKNGLTTEIVDARECLSFQKIDSRYEILHNKSKTDTLKRFNSIDINTIPVISGFIASNEKGETITLGRNGSNYSASLFAQFLQATEVQNWTDVDGIYSADPTKVDHARKIKKMSYLEANELASFGMNLLHSKTIIPLKQTNIPLRILSTKFPNHAGTLINKTGGEKGIKAVTSINDVALITIEGNELKHNIGIDARIFSGLSAKSISVKMISQASTENGIGFVISAADAHAAERILLKEFEKELHTNHINAINVNLEIGIISIIGRHNFALEKAILTLRKNNIWMHLISNSISGRNISLVIDRHLLTEAISLVHNEVFV